MTTVQVFEFFPFPTRVGDDPVIGLRFSFEDAALRDRLKACLAYYRKRAVDPARHITTAGGWLPEAKAWFVEPSVWPQVRYDLAAAGAEFEMVERPAGVPHHHLTPKVVREPSAPSAPSALAAGATGQMLATEPDGVADIRIVEEFITSAAEMGFSPECRAGGSVLVRVPVNVWDRFHRELWRALQWKGARGHAEMDRAYEQVIQRTLAE